MERSGTSVAGQTKEAAVLRKGGNRKKRTTKELSIFFYCRLLYPCAHQGRRKKRRRREHRFPPSVFYWVGCAVGYVVIYVFLVFYVMRTNVLSCLRWFEIADRVRNEGLDGFQVRWCVKIEVETAAGGVFAHHKASVVGKARRPFIRFP